jgi:tetratricopeptide (TPR) repeat protein
MRGFYQAAAPMLLSIVRRAEDGFDARQQAGLCFEKRGGSAPPVLERSLAHMRRDTVVFTVAGILFGFVVGYMAAGWGQRPEAVSGSAAAPASGPAAPASSTLDPNEEQALVALAERDPGDVAVRVELGNLYMDHQMWEKAIRWYREAVTTNPGLLNVRTDLGACLVHAGRPAEGLAEFEAVLQQDEGHRNALYNKGIALTRLGRTEEAVAAWEEVLRRHPGDPQLRGLQEQIDQLRASSPGA